jgi:AbrB family looped-hinge helix DNA binding protein
MMTAQISDKGQLTVPASVRRKFGMKPKSRVEIEIRDDGLLIKPIRSVLELSGIFHEYAKGKTTDWDTIREETMRIVAEEVAREGLE